MEELEIDLTLLSLKNGSAPASINIFELLILFTFDASMRGVHPP